MIASFVLDSTRRSHSMDALAREVLNITPIPISDLIGKGKKQISFDSVDTRRACEYAAEDADITWQLAEVFRPQLADSELETLFRSTELPLVSVLARMESTGVAIDVDFLATMSKQLSDRLDQLRSEIHEHAGEPFNIDSPKQLARILFEVLELPVIRRTKTGQSTDADTLDALVPLTDNLVPSLVREYRELSKLKGTYVDTLPRMICARTGRIHASFHQTAAITGRLSSSNPNLQNIPIRTEIGQKIRRAFIPRDDDHLLLAADYSQVELRILAHFCRDQTLIDAFANDEDIHRFVASQVFSVPLEDVSKEQRSQAKAVNFGIVYGQTAYGLSRSTGMPVGQAQAFIDMYFMRYPGIQMFIDETIARARKQGYVQTILGRRRAIPEINSRNKNLRSQGERLAVNTVIQGTAADLIKQAMIHIDRSIREDRRPSKMLIQVHDELVFDIPRDAIQEESAFIREEMINAMQFDVPLKVDLAWGNNWLESK
jgi:DNA polymerase-1